MRCRILGGPGVIATHLRPGCDRVDATAPSATTAAEWIHGACWP